MNAAELGAILRESLAEGSYDEIDASVSDADFKCALADAAGKDTTLIGLFCVQDFEGHAGFTLFYVLESRATRSIVVLTRRLEGGTACSVASCFPSACWFEREIRDGFGVEFPDAFDKRPLFLHETYPAGFHPLLKSFKNSPIPVGATSDTGEEYQFKRMQGEGVYQIPVGPVHAGIIEPGHFRFSVIGETIFNLEIRMFYKHRGMEKLAEGKDLASCMAVAETISGDESAVNAVALAMCAEEIDGVEAPPRAWAIRTIALEMERIYSHLGDMAGMIVDVAYAKGAAPFFILREDMLRQNEAISGSRFLKGIVKPGGLKRDMAEERLKVLSDYLDRFAVDFASAVARVRSVTSVMDRLETTGVIKQGLSVPLNITGPAARAAGIPVDTRIDYPYGIYQAMGLKKRMAETSDVLARFTVKSEEVLDSANMIRRLIATLPGGEIDTRCEPQNGHALVLIESPRGQSLHWLCLKDGLVDRYKVRTASFCNWQAIEHAVLGNIVPDFPLINKSLNLSYAGTDL